MGQQSCVSFGVLGKNSFPSLFQLLEAAYIFWLIPFLCRQSQQQIISNFSPGPPSFLSFLPFSLSRFFFPAPPRFPTINSLLCHHSNFLDFDPPAALLQGLRDHIEFTWIIFLSQNP